MIDNIEQRTFENSNVDIMGKIEGLHQGFDTKVTSTMGYYQGYNSAVLSNLSQWLSLDKAGMALNTNADALQEIKKMYSGTIKDGVHTLGIDKISHYKKNPDYKEQNLKQQAGFSAEVMSTAKENVTAAIKETGITTYRADDRLDLFAKNDQYVDKIRVDKNDKIIDRIQVKFVGNDAATCLSKLASAKYDKYFESGKVDKMEIPKDYFDQVKALIPQRIDKLEKQLERVTADGKTDVANDLQKRIDRYHKIDSMLEKSTVTKAEAEFATKHPKRYTARLFSKELVNYGNEAGKKSGKEAIGITTAASTVENIKKVINGEISVNDALKDTAKDVGVAGSTGYGSSFVSSVVANGMMDSGHALIRSLGTAGIPGAAISFGVDSFDSVTDYANGNITKQELAYDLGNSATGIGGAVAVGAAAGSVIPGPGTAVGLVGSMVGYAVASEAYKTAIEAGVENVGPLSEKAESMAKETLEQVKTQAPDKVDAVRNSMNKFAEDNNLPFDI